MLSYGAGFALWTALALTKVSGGLCGSRSSEVPAEPGGRSTQRGRGWEVSPGGVRRLAEPGASLRVFLPFSPQAAPGEAAGCSANLTERRVAGQSVRLRWGAAGSACNFSLSGRSEDGEAVGCQPAPAGNGSYGCSLQGLEAGTWYHLRIEPLADGEAVNISVQTGTGGAGHGRCSGAGRDARLFLPVPLLQPGVRGGG